MLIEIINVGNELLNGSVTNTNAQFLTQELYKAGFRVALVSVVPDIISDIITQLKMAWARSKVIIITGGLGPTHDDVTSEAICQFLDIAPMLHLESLQNMKERFAARGIPMPEVNKRQAFVPENSIVIPNYEGTAPGFCIEKDEHQMFVMPGVPHEMKAMFTRMVLPRICSRFPPQPFIRCKFRTTSVPESELFTRLEFLKWLPSFVTVASLPSTAGVDLELEFKSQTEKAHVDDVLKRFEKMLGDCVYSHENEKLEEVVAKILTEDKKKIAVAESCSGGLIMHRLTEVPGASNFFKEGIVAYSNDAKVRLLGVATATIERFGAVSAECAREMASGVRVRANADIGIATTGIAGPTGSTSLKPLGLVYIAYADRQTCNVTKLVFKDSRSIHKDRTSQAALALLWKHIRHS